MHSAMNKENMYALHSNYCTLKPTRTANNTFLQSKPVIWYISKCMQDNLSN